MGRPSMMIHAPEGSVETMIWPCGADLGRGDGALLAPPNVVSRVMIAFPLCTRIC